MYNLLSYILTLFFLIAGIYKSNAQNDFRNITLLDNWKQDSLITSPSLARYNECWGYNWNDQEYAIAGSTEGTHFFQIDQNGKFLDAGFIKGDFSSTQVIHRDFKNYRNFLYSVCDEGTSNLQIIDLSFLPDSVKLIKTINEPFGRVHNLYIDTTNALLYAFILTTIENGLPKNKYSMRVFSLADPINPLLVYTGPNDIPEVHDGYVRDNIAILNCGFDGLRMYDFSNPSSPIFKQNLNIYQEQGYNHQGWLSPDGETYVFGDETNGKKLKFCKKDENGDWKITNYFGTNFNNGSVPHNIMIDNEFIYVAYYNEGLRVYSYRGAGVKEVAFYNTYSTDNPFKMNGAWGVFTQFKSGRILVSDRQNGLFLFDFQKRFFQNNVNEDYRIYPNPVKAGSTQTFQLATPFQGTISMEIHSLDGKFLRTASQSNFNYFNFKVPEVSGVYFLKIKYINFFGEEINLVEKIIVD
ncbi:MAG: choice-of-anchor B family protein [Bacteroidetes bacterium]|nr:choice-of-anchor B family protein [Bacteroidota bacterium]